MQLLDFFCLVLCNKSGYRVLKKKKKKAFFLFRFDGKFLYPSPSMPTLLVIFILASTLSIHKCDSYLKTCLNSFKSTQILRLHFFSLIKHLKCFILVVCMSCHFVCMHDAFDCMYREAQWKHFFTISNYCNICISHVLILCIVKFLKSLQHELYIWIHDSVMAWVGFI